MAIAPFWFSMFWVSSSVLSYFTFFKVHINRFNSPFISLYIFLLHSCPVYVIHDVFDQYHWFTCFLLTMSLVRDSHRQVHFQSRCPSFPLLEDRDRRTTLTPLSGLEGHLADGFCHEKFPCRSDLFHRSIPHSMWKSNKHNIYIKILTEYVQLLLRTKANLNSRVCIVAYHWHQNNELKRYIQQFWVGVTVRIFVEGTAPLQFALVLPSNKSYSLRSA